LAHERPAEGDRRRHAGEEDEHVGGVAQTEAGRNVIPQEIAAAMGDVDDEHRAAAKEVEARIAALAGRRWLSGPHPFSPRADRRRDVHITCGGIRGRRNRRRSEQRRGPGGRRGRRARRRPPPSCPRPRAPETSGSGCGGTRSWYKKRSWRRASSTPPY